MQAARQLGGGLFYGLISALLVVGGLSLALAETKSPATPTPTLIVRTTIPRTLTATRPAPSKLAPLPTLFPNLVPTITPLSSLPSLPPPTSCTHPSGWIQISVQVGDTLDSLAVRYGTSSAQLIQANCLQTSNVFTGTSLYVPNIPQVTTGVTIATIPAISTAILIPCGPFPGWVLGYIVQPNDTLYHIATMYGATVANMQRANCIADATRIFVGQRLWVPNVPTIVPALTIIPFFGTQTPVPTDPLTLTPLPDTATPVPPTFTVTASPIPVP